MIKYRSDGPAQGHSEVQLYIHQLETEYAIEIDVQLHSHARQPGYMYWEVVFVREGHLGGGEAIYKERAAISTKASANPWGALIFCLSQGMARIENAPWLWPEYRRREATGDAPIT